ncbi:MAG: hypothetical protein NY202_02350 [Mollicutes bacterium UO1]
MKLIPNNCPECGDVSGRLKVGREIRNCKICYLPKEDVPVIFRLKDKEKLIA